jgi:hypothetical protein
MSGRKRQKLDRCGRFWRVPQSIANSMTMSFRLGKPNAFK